MRLLVNFAFCFWLSWLASLAHADRIKDLASLAGVRNNQLVGYGLVVGLSGTGDANLGITLQSMQAMLSRFGMSTDTSGLSGANAAAVMVTADLAPFIKPGQTLDVTVSALGASESLRGGTLLMTPLLGADGQTYAIAQGNLAVGGLGVAAADGSSLTVNIPTVGRVPQGATVEKMVETPFLENEFLILNLHRSDFQPPALCHARLMIFLGRERLFRLMAPLFACKRQRIQRSVYPLSACLKTLKWNLPHHPRR